MKSVFQCLSNVKTETNELWGLKLDAITIYTHTYAYIYRTGFNDVKTTDSVDGFSKCNQTRKFQ